LENPKGSEHLKDLSVDLRMYLRKLKQIGTDLHHQVETSRPFWSCQWTFRFHTKQEIWLGGQLLGSQEGLCSMESVRWWK